MPLNSWDFLYYVSFDFNSFIELCFKTTVFFSLLGTRYQAKRKHLIHSRSRGHLVMTKKSTSVQSWNMIREDMKYYTRNQSKKVFRQSAFYIRLNYYWLKIASPHFLKFLRSSNSWYFKINLWKSSSSRNICHLIYQCNNENSSL